MSLLKFWEWPRQLLGIVSLVIFGFVGFHVADWWLGNHYTKTERLEQKAATAKADAKIAKRQTDNEKRAKEAANAKVQTLQSNLAAANSTADSRGRLLDDVRGIQKRTQNSASACSQYSAALGELLASGTELAGRIAKEADGHAADSLECRKSWPD